MTDTESAASFAEPQLDSPLPAGSENAPLAAQPLGLWADTWRRLRRNKLALVGLGIITVFMLVGVVEILAGVTGIHGGYLAPYDPNAVNYSIAKAAPSLAHPFGTDYIGRDVFSRTLVASRISLLVGVIAVSIALALGLALGPLSGYYGGAFDSVIMRVADVFFAFPYILFVLLLVVVLGPGFRNVFIAIGLLSWASYARIVRGTVLSVKTQEYIEAAKAAGASDLRIVFGHVLPNSMAPVYVAIAMGVGGAIVTEAALSFLGIGVQPPTASWGNMISDYLNYLQAGQWWMELFPCLALVITVFGFISFGNGLRDATDPKLKE